MVLSYTNEGLRGLNEYNAGLHTSLKRDAGINSTGTSSSWTAYFLDPITASTTVANKSIATPEAKSKVPSPSANSSQNIEVSFTKAIRLVLHGNDHNSPAILMQER